MPVSPTSAHSRAGRPIERLVDPFSERPGAVIHDHAGDRAVPDLPDAAKLHGKGHKSAPGRSPLERPGAAGSLDAAQDKKARSKGRPDKEPPVGPRNPPR